MTTANKVLVLVLALATRGVTALPSWTSFFPGLQPATSDENVYYDEEDDLEEAGSPRLGFISLNSGTTSFNTTLNLTGHILLGLGLASSLLLYMYLGAFDKGGSGYHDDGYGKRRKLPSSAVANQTLNLSGVVLFSLGISAVWSLFLYLNAANNLGILGAPREFPSDAPQALNKRQINNEFEELLASFDDLDSNISKVFGLDQDNDDDEDCRALITCEANKRNMVFTSGTIGKTVRDIFDHSEILLDETTRAYFSKVKSKANAFSRHYPAMSLGRQSDERCDRHFPRCSMGQENISKLLQSQVPKTIP